MTEEEQKYFQDFVLKRVRAGKEEKAKAIMQEIADEYNSGNADKKSLRKKGMSIMALIKLEHMAEFIKTATQLQKQFDK